MKNITHNRYLMFIVSFVVACGVATIIPSGEDAAVYGDVVRLHVVANSDVNADQRLKYEVRDEVTAVCRTLLKDCESVEHAREILSDNLEAIEKTAVAKVNSELEGGAYSARATFCREYYPTRDYGAFRLPAGKYDSLKITLGAGAGKNWWCVLYPSLCFEAALADEDIKIISAEPSTPYKIKFRILELAAEIINRI